MDIIIKIWSGKRRERLKNAIDSPYRSYQDAQWTAQALVTQALGHDEMSIANGMHCRAFFCIFPSISLRFEKNTVHVHK